MVCSIGIGKERNRNWNRGIINVRENVSKTAVEYRGVIRYGEFGRK
jgi:hypothetical protein